MTTNTLPLSGLRVDEKSNVRKFNTETSPMFLASVEAHGIVQPLTVRKNGVGHVVIDGQLRLAALQQLQKAGKIEKDYPVPVVIVATGDAASTETSLVSNLVRRNMHPVDEYRGFQTLHINKEEPLDVEAIAKRFGLPSGDVEKLLALGALDDKVLDAWQNGSIDERTAQAFTLCQSKKHQVQLFNKLAKDHSLSAWNVRDELKASDHTVAPMLAFVGAEAYEAKGGKITKDLFGGAHVVSDIAMLKTLVDEKFAAKVEELKAEGWKFVLTARPTNMHAFGAIQPKVTLTADEQKARKVLEATIKKIEDQDDGYAEDDDQLVAAVDARDLIDAAAYARAITPAHRAKSGVLIVYERGQVEITYGITEPKEGPKLKPVAGKVDTKQVKKPAALSQALEQRITLQKHVATKAAITADKHTSKLAVLCAGIVASLIDKDRAFGSEHRVQKQIDAIRATITPTVLMAAQLKAFDGRDYFDNCPKSFGIAAVAEAVSPAEAKKLQGKKGKEIAKFAIANVLKTKWLPKELRFPGYSGPKK